jgi:hypothetical protein
MGRLAATRARHFYVAVISLNRKRNSTAGDAFRIGRTVPQRRTNFK